MFEGIGPTEWLVILCALGLGFGAIKFLLVTQKDRQANTLPSSPAVPQPTGSLLSDETLARRLPLWRAMAGLFQGTQQASLNHPTLAQAVLASGLDAMSVHHILWHEVFPALQGQGLVAGASDAWLIERITAVLAGQPPEARGEQAAASVLLERQAVAQAWAETCAALPLEFQRLAAGAAPH
jgi:hypothetical protein